jgi:hypothetical protein
MILAADTSEGKVCRRREVHLHDHIKKARRSGEPKGDCRNRLPLRRGLRL